MSELAVLVRLEPRPPARIMYRLRVCGRLPFHDLIVPDEKIPRERYLPDLLVLQPLESMEERARLRADRLRRERSHVLGVSAVVEHHGRPVLAGIRGLDRAVHFYRLFGGVFVVNAHDGVSIVGEGEELSHVREVEEVAVNEDRPAGVARKVGGEEPGEGELGALGEVPFAPVEPRGAQIGLLDRDHVDRDRRALQDRSAAYLVGDLLARVVTHEDLERH